VELGDEGRTADEKKRTRTRRLAVAGAAAALSLVFMVYLMLGLPVGVPGEWWIEYRTRLPSICPILLFALAAGAFISAAALLERFKRRDSRGRLSPAAGLVLLYFLFLFASARCGPEGSFEFVAPAFKWDAAGLFRLEAERIEDVGEYLRDFPQRLADYRKPERYRDTVRVNNNPPGATMVFYAARRLAKASPGLARLSSEAVFGVGFEPPDEEFAGTVLGCWMMLAAAALSLVPAIFIARGLGGGSGFLEAAVALTAGSMVLFVPAKDTLQVFLFLCMVCFFICGRRGRGWTWGLAMGVTAAAAFFFTLATAVVVLVVFLAAVWIDFEEGGRSRRRDLAFWAAAAGGLLAGFIALYTATGYNSIASLTACYRNHALFYEYFPRTYWKWLLFNPLEFAMLFGGPLVVLAAFHVARGMPDESPPHPGAARALVLSSLLVLFLLNLSGKNASEAARLWVFFMPLLALPSAVLEARRAGGFGNLILLAGMQLLYVIILRVYLDVWRVEALVREIAPVQASFS